MKDSEELLRAALTRMPQGLTEHVMRVLDEALRLAPIHGVDREAAKLAVLGHDLLRHQTGERLLQIAAEQSYVMEDADRMEPILLHGPLAVPVLQEQYGVHDADVLAAVAGHTTARPGMTRLQKLVFLADKIEPHKAGGRGPVMRVADLAETNLDAAMAAYLDYQITQALEHRWALHPNTIAARNELLAAARPTPAK